MEIENELLSLVKEFAQYRKENCLWTVPQKETTYQVAENDAVTRVRVIDGKTQQPQIFY